MKDLVQIAHSAGKNILVDRYRIENNDINLANFLAREEKLNELFDTIKNDVFIILGGDGTILKAVYETAEQKIDYLPINFGTKGYLLNSIEAIENHNGFKRKSYNLLDINITTEEGKTKARAFNEVAIKTGGAKMIDIDVSIGGHSTINLKGDGLLVVTPAGSTGYNRSARGPLLPPNSNNFIATPLLVFEPMGIMPVQFSNKQIVEIHKNNARKPELSIFADDQTLLRNYEGNVDIVVKKSKLKVNFLIANSYLKEYENKVFTEQGFYAK